VALFTDQHYTSCMLANELQKKRLHLTSTIMKKRSGLLVAVKKDEMEKAKDKGLEKGQPNDVLGKAKQETSTDAQHVPQR